MRMTPAEYANYIARRGGPHPQEASPEKIDLDAKPTELQVAGEQTLSLMHEIKNRGGLITCMTKGRQNGHWLLSITWPDTTTSIP